MTAEEYYQKGNEYRKQSQWHKAINCYIKAIELDPDSPAVEAKRMLDDIMAFYCKDMWLQCVSQIDTSMTEIFRIKPSI